MTVPESPHIQEQEHVYDIAPGQGDPKPAAAPRAPRVPLAPLRKKEKPVEETYRTAPVVAAAPQTLAYQNGPTQKQVERASKETVLDMMRDIYAPATLIVMGLLISVCYSATRYHGNAGAIVAGLFSISVLTAIKTVLLIGFAFVVAGPLGVSFGGLGTAALKLAAIAIFVESTCLWVDWGADKLGGVAFRSISGWGILSFPLALGIYWMLLIYLFSMDSGDSWTVVVLLSVFDRFTKMILFLVVLQLLFSASPLLNQAANAASKAPQTPQSAKMYQEIDDLKDSGHLLEARAFIKDGHQSVMTGTVDDWYKSGCQNVWFEVSGFMGSKPVAEQVIVELPSDKDARAKCYQILSTYYKNIGATGMAGTDTGDPFLFVMIRQ
jgi:hypothetical protein